VPSIHVKATPLKVCFKVKSNISLVTAKYFCREKQGTKCEDCGHLDDREQQLVGFRDALCLFGSSPLPFSVFVFPFKDGYHSGGDQEHYSPKEQEICSRGATARQTSYTTAS